MSWSRWKILALAGLGAAACAAGQEEPARAPSPAPSGANPCANHDPTPAGSVADYALRRGGEISRTRIAAPLSCEQESAYIKLVRDAGQRRLGTERDASGAFREGCMELPPDASDMQACPVVNPAAVLQAVARELERAGVVVNGVGLGPCGQIRGGYAAWNFAIGVVDWRHAERAVQLTAEMLASYDIRGSIGVAVRGIACGVALGGS